MLPAMEYTYRYDFSSGIVTELSGKTLALSAFNPKQANPFICEGRVRSPRVFAEMLLALSHLMQPYGLMPQFSAFPDPLLTINDRVLRMEGFNYGGIYVRVDFSRDTFIMKKERLGSTSVNFNRSLKHALKQIRDWDRLYLSVGKDVKSHDRDESAFYEKKVKVPLACMNGFRSVQASQQGLFIAFDVKAIDGLKLMQRLPCKTKSSHSGYMVKEKNSIRFSYRRKENSVFIPDTHRLKNLRPLLLHAGRFRAWTNKESRVSAFEVLYPKARFYLLFNTSAEGPQPNTQNHFISGNSVDMLSQKVIKELCSQSEVNSTLIAEKIQERETNVQKTLFHLLDKGLLGYDVSKGLFFHRELPFDMNLVETLTLRLNQAKQLANSGRVIALKKKPNEAEYFVTGDKENHRVHIRPQGDHCTCPYFSFYKGEKGPCKHILAAQLASISFTDSL